MIQIRWSLRDRRSRWYRTSARGGVCERRRLYTYLDITSQDEIKSETAVSILATFVEFSWNSLLVSIDRESKWINTSWKDDRFIGKYLIFLSSIHGAIICNLHFKRLICSKITPWTNVLWAELSMFLRNSWRISGDQSNPKTSAALAQPEKDIICPDGSLFSIILLY